MDRLPRAYDLRTSARQYLFVGAVERLKIKRKAEMARRVISDHGGTHDGPDDYMAAMWDRTPTIRRDALRVRTIQVPDGPHARTALDYRDDHGMGEFPAGTVIVTVS